MNNLSDLVSKKIIGSVNDSGYDLYHVEFVKEMGHSYLRVMITNKNYDDAVTIKDCEVVSKTINSLIDELNINTDFFLEVSSPGINRRLYTLEHMNQAVGKLVRVKLMKPINGNKKYIGVLKCVDNGKITLEVKETEFKINLNIIKNINLEEISQEDIHE